MAFNDGLPYKVKFELKRTDTIQHLSMWCRDNCTGKYTYQYTAFCFHFEKSEDAMMFRFETLK